MIISVPIYGDGYEAEAGQFGRVAKLSEPVEAGVNADLTGSPPPSLL